MNDINNTTEIGMDALEKLCEAKPKKETIDLDEVVVLTRGQWKTITKLIKTGLDFIESTVYQQQQLLKVSGASGDELELSDEYNTAIKLMDTVMDIIKR